MDRRRRKDEPFNPFAPNASQKAKERKDKTQRPTPRPKAPEVKKPQEDLAAKQRAAMEAMRNRRELEQQSKPKPVKQEISKPKHQPSPQPKPAPKTEVKRPSKREDRLADLRAKSAATAQFAKEAQDAKKAIESDVKEIQSEVVPETDKNTELNQVEPIIEEIEPDGVVKGSSNVFKTIRTEVNKTDRKQKRRRPADKRGGGRQPQSKKLDRRKYLEYKYAARELLDNDSVSEEHRSNILGQIWAKGERSGVDDAIEFINQKEAELIIPEEVAEEFRRMVKKYTTKR
tara:strand:- start:1772 stop:2632 length:861 start_codon:yes stop_codon:yes gene_type:complete